MATITKTNVQDNFVTLNGLRFHYREWGDESAPPLVLLHGYTSHARSWDKFADAMSDTFRVLALDQRGQGETEWASDYAPERMVEDVDAFARALDLDKFALVGLSMGGRNAYLYTAHHPESVERLVIVDIGPEVSASGGARIRAGVLANDVFADRESAFRAARAANARPSDDDMRYRVFNNLMQRDDGAWTYRYDKALRSPDRPLPRPDPEKSWAMLSRITCATLLVRGARVAITIAAARLGLDLIGVTAVRDLPETRTRMLRWIDEGKQGAMGWITPERAELSTHPDRLLPGVRSIISVAVPPGVMPFTRMPCGAQVTAAVPVMLLSACFIAP